MCDKVNELRHKQLISKERKTNKSSGSSDQPSEKLVDLYKKMKRSNPAALPRVMPPLSNRSLGATSLQICGSKPQMPG